MLSQLDEIKFPFVVQILNTQQYGSILNDENEFIICNICNSFQASSNKSPPPHTKEVVKENSVSQLKKLLL